MISTDNFVAEQALNQRQFTALKARDAEWRAERDKYKGRCEDYERALHQAGVTITQVAALKGELAEARRLRPKVMAFALIMEEKLKLNDSKRGWSECKPSWLFRRLAAEVNELHRIVARRKQGGLERGIGKEAADVANFAMMIADVCGALAATPAEQAQQPQGVNPSPPFMRDDQGRSRAAEQAQGEGAKGLADDLREANENIERMKARYKEQSAELRAMEEDRDNWRQKRVDVGIAYDHFAARHKGPGCGRREADAHIAALAKRVEALTNLVTSLARDSATQGAMVEVQNKVAALEAERPGKGWVGHYCDQPTACPHRMTPPAPPPPEAAGPGHAFKCESGYAGKDCSSCNHKCECGVLYRNHAVPPIPEGA